MTIRGIDGNKCEPCTLRIGSGCPIMDSCHTDAIRLNKKGFPYIAYPTDCDNCLLCMLDCPNGAVDVSCQIPRVYPTM